MSRDYRLYLDDIVESAARVERYTQGLSLAEFQDSDMAHDAVLHNLLVIGEAVKNIPVEVRDRYPDVAWRAIAGLRDVIAHGYFGLIDETIWDIVQHEMPPLLKQMRAIIAAESTDSLNE